MSLEAAIQENTAVMRELIAALTAAGALQTAQASAAAHSSPAVQAVVKAQKEADAKKSTAKAKPDTAGDAAAAPADEAASESKPSGKASTSTDSLHDWHEKTAELHAELDGGEPTLENLRKAILGINSKIGRPQADAVLARFGAKAITSKPNTPGLDEAQYADAFALCLDVLSGRVDATLAIPE